MEQYELAILIAVLVIFITTLLVFLLRRSVKRNTILFVGLSDAGKTLMFSRFVTGLFVFYKRILHINIIWLLNRFSYGKLFLTIDFHVLCQFFKNKIAEKFDSYSNLFRREISTKMVSIAPMKMFGLIISHGFNNLRLNTEMAL